MVSVEDRQLRGGGYNLKQEIWNAARDTISEWTGQELTECSLYGIRVYKVRSRLLNHTVYCSGCEIDRVALTLWSMF